MTRYVEGDESLFGLYFLADTLPLVSNPQVTSCLKTMNSILTYNSDQITKELTNECHFCHHKEQSVPPFHQPLLTVRDNNMSTLPTPSIWRL